MRLLKFGSGGELSLPEDFFTNAPPYAILSHTWGADDEEITFKDLENQSGKSKAGYNKIQFCGEQARKDGLQYFWVDTCCIDKANHTELSEAITSMFRWYRDAVKCYVYLQDVSARKSDNNGQTQQPWESAFRRSRWFTRGWTLQELLAPKSVEFYSRDRELLGDKKKLEQQIHEITGIPIAALRGESLSCFSVDERMRWAEKRETKRKEDKAYCLLGIFGVFMTLIYGEGDDAFIRLKSKIDKCSRMHRTPHANPQAAALDEATKSSLSDLYDTDPRDDMDRIESSKDLLLKRCYEWILRDPILLEWRRNNTNPHLWISGDPGKGKTMLMIALVRELSNGKPDESSAVTFFFCQATDSRLNNATSVLRGLIWKLAENRIQLARIFHEKYQLKKSMFSGPNALHALFSTLLALLEALPGTMILIDALDECKAESGRNQLLQLIANHGKSSKAKWLLSSRNYPEIKQILKHESYMLSLELNGQHISSGVQVFVKRKIAELAMSKDYDADLAEKVKEELVRKADSTYLWVALACKRLHSVTRRKTLATLNNIPPGLEKLYVRMLEQVLQNEDTDDRNFCCQILRSMTLAFRPLSEKELFTVTELPKDLLDNNGLRELVDLCGSFVDICDGILYFVHQSAKDYLIGSGAHEIFPAGLQVEHGLVVDRSLSVMSKTLKRDMCNLRHPGCLASSATNNAGLEEIGYSCSFWVNHLAGYVRMKSFGSLLGQRYLSDGGYVHNFLLKHLLQWIEALSLIGELDKGITGLYSLEQMIEELTKSPTKIGHDHQNFVHDAIRVLRQFRPAIEKAPLQVYYSTLIFSPANSIIRQNFKGEAPCWIFTLPRIPQDWSPCQQTLEGHTAEVWSVAYSPDGRQLASGSGDSTVRLWDTITGACHQTLEGHTSWVWSVAYSPDGRQLASSSHDSTVRLWDMITGACHQTLEGHTDRVWSVAYSPDGRQLASGSRDSTVRLWDTATGACHQTLEGHTDGVFSVAYSPDGRQLASSSHDSTVRLWDTVTGACHQTLEGHTDRVWSVAYSPDGRQLASGSRDSTVRLWDTATGACYQTLEGHKGGVLSVAYSPDGRQLASGSRDSTVRLWDTTTGACHQTLEGPIGWVFSMGYSPDGRQLASSSHDGTVQLWDTITGFYHQTLEGHTGGVFSVAYSPDGQQLASGSGDSTVRLWDMATGPYHQTFEGHIRRVWSVAYSPDGRQLASSSHDSTVRLWDTTTGACHQTLEGHTAEVLSVAYSPDGRQLASSSEDGTVRLWDTTTGACHQTLEGHTAEVLSVAYSPDGRQLASSSEDGTVRLWDTTTGACHQTLEGHAGPVAFSSDGSVLVTSSQAWSAKQTFEVDRSLQLIGCGIQSEKKWITWNGSNILWLAPEYRPVVSAVKENCIAVGCQSGLVYILNFCADPLLC